jgi:hypothetical protein
VAMSRRSFSQKRRLRLLALLFSHSRRCLPANSRSHLAASS